MEMSTQPFRRVLIIVLGCDVPMVHQLVQNPSYKHNSTIYNGKDRTMTCILHPCFQKLLPRDDNGHDNNIICKQKAGVQSGNLVLTFLLPPGRPAEQRREQSDDSVNHAQIKSF
jgi:hypothetical protein